jgi:hypothetical protein
MANTQKVVEAIKQATEELLAMPDEEVQKLFDDIKDEDLDPAFVEFCNGIFPTMDEAAWVDDIDMGEIKE